MITIEKLHDYWNDNKSKFESIVNNTAYERCGIWFTEGFLACSIYDMLGVDTVLESGRAYGQSTEIFAKYGFNVISIDTCTSYKDAENIAQTRLQGFSNVSLLKGNSTVMFPNLVKQHSDKNIGLFIDGPKGVIPQNSLVESCKQSNVLVAAFHDRQPENNMYHTHTIDFIYNEFNYLNNKVLNYKKDHQMLRRYAPKGPGILINIIK